MSYTVVWDEPNIQVRAIISSRDEFKQLLEALGNAEKNLPVEKSATAIEEKPHAD